MSIILFGLPHQVFFVDYMCTRVSLCIEICFDKYQDCEKSRNYVKICLELLTNTCRILGYFIISKLGGDIIFR